VFGALDEPVRRASSSSQLDECVLSAYVLDIESIYAVDRLTGSSFDKLACQVLGALDELVRPSRLALV